MKKQLYVALEVDFMLALGLGDPYAESCIDIISSLRGYPLVTPSVLQEMQDQLELFAGKPEGRIPKLAMSLLCNANILTPPLTPIEHGIAERVAIKLLDAKLCFSCQTALVIL
ncbi:MAG: hypothetical protein HW418_4277 [Anaerolineales bacterium]|nr:hypothetical protein [Anaerolineales bacterium]